MSTELAELAGRLELHLRPDGTPVNPLVVLALDGWRDAPPGLIRRAAAPGNGDREENGDREKR